MSRIPPLSSGLHFTSCLHPTMTPVRNARVLFKSVPAEFPELGKTMAYDDSETIDLEKVPLQGGFLVKTLYLSIDPYMRGRMRSPESKSYVPAFKINEPLTGFGVGVVIRSDHHGVKHGDHVYYAEFPHQEYFIMNSLEGVKILKKKEELPWSAYLGAVGMPGMTAYCGWKEYSVDKEKEKEEKEKKGKKKVAFVTAGGGPVGSMVIQLAKMDHFKVISSAGSDEKVQFMRDIGADVPFNYKTTSTEEVLKKEGPIDVYWDNVGGESLDLALKYSNEFARFIECGMISTYNKPAKPIENMMNIIGRSLFMQGFIVFNLEHKHGEEFYRTIPEMLAKGKLRYREEIHEGLQAVPEAVVCVQHGRNKAKAVVEVAKG